jgi:hypothetical protein
MSKVVLKSNNSLMAITPSPAFSTSNQTAFLFGGVIDSNFSFKLDRQSLTQLGSQEYIANHVNRHPDVEFNITYLFNPLLLNERSMGMLVTSTGTSSLFSNFRNRSNNFVYLIAPDQENDALEVYSSSTRTFNGFEAVSIGNAFLRSYSVEYAIGKIPTVQASFIGSNIKFEKLTADTIQSPAIDLQAGGNFGVGNIAFANGIDESFRITPSISRPDNIQVSLQNLQVGGQSLSGAHIVQSLSLSLDIQREDLYGLGSNYVRNRKLKFPIIGNINVSSLVSGFNSGTASGLINNESGYDFEIEFKSYDDNYSGKYIVQNAKLENYSYSIPLNGISTFDASFSFSATETSGIKAAGPTDFSFSEQTWAISQQIWSGVNEDWV